MVKIERWYLTFRKYYIEHTIAFGALNVMSSSITESTLAHPCRQETVAKVRLSQGA